MADKENSVALWKSRNGGLVGYGKLEGKHIRDAVWVSGKDKDGNPPPDNRPVGGIYWRMDDTPSYIPIWKNDKGHLGNTGALPGHFINVFVNDPDPQYPNSPAISVNFKAKDVQAAAPAQSMGDQDSIPF